MNRCKVIGSALLIAATLAACSSNSKTAASSSPAGSTTTPAPTTSATSTPAAPSSSKAPVSAGAATITIKNFAFSIAGKISAAQLITVKNEDSQAHTVTSDTGGVFDVMVPASGTATLTAPSKPGAYKFHCSYHANMHASLTVS